MAVSQNKPYKKKQYNIIYPKIAFIGFRGIGKTTLVQSLCSQIEYPFCSSDTYIEKKYDMTITNIVNSYNWNKFREIEKNTLIEINNEYANKLVLDCGGGIVEGKNESKSEDNIFFLKENFFTVYLHIEKQYILNKLSRLQNVTSRPSLGENHQQSILDAYDRRLPWYEEASHATLDISGANQKEVLIRVLDLIVP